MKLYHGSNVFIEQIDLSKSKPNKDFGRAFYLSDLRFQAEEMAAFKVDFLGGSLAVTEFEFDEAVLESGDLKFKRFEGYTMDWAKFIYNHRTDPHGRTLHDYDIVYGPIANDRIGLQIANFQNGYISFEEFYRRIQFMKGITYQYAFCTPLAISKLRKL